MKRSEQVLAVIALGSLWGLFEIMPLSTGILCAVGVLFLVMARRIVNIPGTSILIGLLVCLYKTYSAHFMVCQTAGVMSLAVTFDLLASTVLKFESPTLRSTAMIGVAANIIALPIFVTWVTYVAQVPFWVSGGWERIFEYALYTTLVAAVLSLVFAPTGLKLAELIRERWTEIEHRLLTGIYYGAVVVALTVATAVRFL